MKFRDIFTRTEQEPGRQLDPELIGLLEAHFAQNGQGAGLATIIERFLTNKLNRAQRENRISFRAADKIPIGPCRAKIMEEIDYSSITDANQAAAAILNAAKKITSPQLKPIIDLLFTNGH